MKNNKKTNLLVGLFTVALLAGCSDNATSKPAGNTSTGGVQQSTGGHESTGGNESTGDNQSTNSNSSGGSQVDPNATYTYKDYTVTSPSNWNELTYQDNNDTRIMSFIGSSFFSFDFKFDAKGQIVPGDFEIEYSAATALEDVTEDYAGDEKWGIDEDVTSARAYKITLREDLKWDDGTPIVAEDFVYTMKEQLNPLFLNYRADSFYAGATVIHNAQNYVKQGQTIDEKVGNVYASLEEAMATYTEIYLDYDVVKSQINAWFGYSGYDLSVFDGEGFFDQYFAIYAGEGEERAPSKDAEGNVINFFDKYGLTNATSGARVKVTQEMINDYNNMDMWDPNADKEIPMLSVIDEYVYPAVDFDNVGIFVGENAYEIVLVLDIPLALLKEDGSLSYKAAYNMSSLPLVHKAKFEANKVAPVEGSTLWTSTYNSDVASTASWGPYKLTSFQAGKAYTLERNENWYGYGMEQYKGQYQTTKIEVETIAEWNTAWLAFQSGDLTGIGIDVSVADDYKNSSRALYTPDDYVGSMQLQSDREALEGRESEGVNKTILTYPDFRKAISLAVNRAEYNKNCTTSSLAGFGLFNSMHYYDVENGGAYRESDYAKQVLCDVYGIDVDDFESLDAAVDSITGYDLNQARELVTSAYNQALADGEISETDKVVLTFGSGADNESVRRVFNFLTDTLKEMVVGTPLEGRLETTFEDHQNKWADDFRAGAYDICTGGWTGAAWDPGYFLLAYLSPDYMYSTAWDTANHNLTFTMPELDYADYEGEGVELTMGLLDWYDCLNGNAADSYNWAEGAIPVEARLALIARLEKEILLQYYTVPISYSFGASLLSYQVEYITREYNTFMGYGGIRYMTYNYTDAEWADYLENHELDYKK